MIYLREGSRGTQEGRLHEASNRLILKDKVKTEQEWEMSSSDAWKRWFLKSDSREP